MAGLRRLWTSSSISFPTKYRLFEFLKVSVLLDIARSGRFTITQNAEYRHPIILAKLGLARTRHQTRLSLQDCSPGHARRRCLGCQKTSWLDNVKE
ncbi:hypothetical protein DPMN_054352 [Dreissena polymorpha]|uniref:Uncharacterized protein n=1 Tax=Dreissena polymorpha TaxID=45954 RepID=A0A9D4HRI0_DREPO|nr:hypothetical protein DPMN_054352 [Dreissena polymorpha]